MRMRLSVILNLEEALNSFNDGIILDAAVFTKAQVRQAQHCMLS